MDNNNNNNNGLVCFMGRRDSSALVGSPPRDGVSIKKTGGCATLSPLPSF